MTKRGSSSDIVFPCIPWLSRDALPRLLDVVVLSRSRRKLLFPTCCRFLLGLVKLSCCTFRVCICLVCGEKGHWLSQKYQWPRPALMPVDACLSVLWFSEVNRSAAITVHSLLPAVLIPDLLRHASSAYRSPVFFKAMLGRLLFASL